MQSLFIISPSGEVLIEKHWRKVTSRNLLDLFLEHVNQSSDPNDVLPVITMASHYLINVYKEKLFLLCVVVDEVSPALVVEFLYRVLDILKDYFKEVNEVAIKENFSTVYQLLEEMCDNGFPLITEPNPLKEMIAPPSIQSRIVAAVSGKSSVADVLPDGTVSSMPWRKKGAHYNVNSIYFDIVEELDCIIGRNGQIVTCDVFGSLSCRSNLSGMPDLLVSFQDPYLIQDFSLHPCVRVTRFEQERTLSFVPPDGNFTMMNYKVDPEVYSNINISDGKRNYSRLPIPLYCQPQITYSDYDGNVDIMVGSKSVGRLQGKPEFLATEEIVVVIPFPRSVRSTDLKCNVGTVICDEITKECKWKIGKIPKDAVPKLTGTFTMLPDIPRPEDTLTILLEFKVPDTSVSNLQISEINLLNETYDPYKYIRSTLRSGRIQVRCP